MRERIVATVLAAAKDRPLLVVGLDDLHWADPASLRVLRLLVSSVGAPGACWCSRPGASTRSRRAPLADVVEAMARAHAVRRQPARPRARRRGSEVFETVSGNRPVREQADALRDRTDGNPFFLVEYARLAGERTEVPPRWSPTRRPQPGCRTCSPSGWVGCRPRR